MPLYEIEHSIPLDKPQRDALAQAITHIYTRQFTTPSLFVNVKFVDARNQHNYVAGKERSINRIIAYVRTGGSRCGGGPAWPCPKTGIRPQRLVLFVLLRAASELDFSISLA
ncbi:hypothetical protein BP00DRAFT_411913 [Aspergillus indologenus CBS 114.80]|uniref:Tautomerase cis-CaaD-like domain-containing protein n=1 Tax=Aspergillus indologenus CBS 114.80 TaxID=1450541 RepID=A0A2V5JAR0_9EURO|nr:hypothetical protein BP00DRAFT_411913 [Aspergillus indologenus CBS 114.80]